jgi:hypothetical protein
VPEIAFTDVRINGSDSDTDPERISTPTPPPPPPAPYADIIGSAQGQTSNLAHSPNEIAESDERGRTTKGGYEDKIIMDVSGAPVAIGEARVIAQHIGLLIEFMDKYIQLRINYIQSENCHKVFFSDLWYLF